jgi:filamentous hemagglutinin
MVKDSKSQSANVSVNRSGSFGAGVSSSHGNREFVDEQTSIIGSDRVDIGVDGHTQNDGGLIANMVLGEGGMRTHFYFIC